MIIPSRIDNLPNTALESLMCSTPVVAFRTSGLVDIIDHKENGYLQKPFDIDDLHNGIEWILNLDKNIYELLCDNARKKALTKYNPIKVSNKYLNLYNNIIKKNKTIIN